MPARAPLQPATRRPRSLAGPSTQTGKGRASPLTTDARTAGTDEGGFAVEWEIPSRRSEPR